MEIYNTLYEETPRLDFYKPFLWESCPFIQQQIIEKYNFFCSLSYPYIRTL